MFHPKIYSSKDIYQNSENVPKALSWNLEIIEKMSKNAFKNLVKKHARNYEFSRFLEIKKTKSKMKNLFYQEFKLQNYLLLKNMNTFLYKFRVRMAPFGENFRGGQVKIMCPFCGNHADGQAESWICTKMNKMMVIKGKYEDIFGQTFTHELVKTAESLSAFREEFEKL